MKKGFWPNSTIALIGGGSFGTVLSNILAENCEHVRVWVRAEERAREMNSTRSNPQYVPGIKLSEKINVTHQFEKVFEGGVDAIVWALPSRVCREQAKMLAPHISGSELMIHVTKGIEQGTLKRISTILEEELPCRRIGVLSGPNLAIEIAQGDPGATVVASRFEEVVEAGVALFSTPSFRVYGSDDVIGVEWAGVLKNILAIASGCLEALGKGYNTRAMLVSRGLAEMVRFGLALGAKKDTFLGLAGVGDLLATCSSTLSRNYRVGFRLGKGESLEQILSEIESTAEGISTTESVFEFAQERKISMPITEGVYRLIRKEKNPEEVLSYLMTHPRIEDIN